MAQRTIYDWFSEYSESHQNHTNKLIHWICVPSIFFSVVCLLSMVPVASVMNLAEVLMVFAALFYARLSPKIAAGLVLFYLLCLWGARMLAQLPMPLWQTALIIFVVAWIGQFIGHKIEGKKPSFLKDIQFLLIGPAWLLGFVYRRLGINF
jgi:uncharacterized membrane protein YGL010W